MSLQKIVCVLLRAHFYYRYVRNVFEVPLCMLKFIFHFKLL